MSDERKCSTTGCVRRAQWWTTWWFGGDPWDGGGAEVKQWICGPHLALWVRDDEGDLLSAEHKP